MKFKIIFQQVVNPSSNFFENAFRTGAIEGDAVSLFVQLIKVAQPKALGIVFTMMSKQ